MQDIRLCMYCGCRYCISSMEVVRKVVDVSQPEYDIKRRYRFIPVGLCCANCKATGRKLAYKLDEEIQYGKHH